MTTITRSVQSDLVEIERLDNGEVSLKQIHRSVSTPTFNYTPHEAVQIAYALLEAAGVEPKPEERSTLAGEAWDAAAEENEHARQRQERAEFAFEERCRCAVGCGRQEER